MVTISRRSQPDGTRYELASFADYVQELRQRGVEPPLANYRIFVSRDDEQVLRRTCTDFEQQIARFFKLSPATDVAYHFQDET